MPLGASIDKTILDVRELITQGSYDLARSLLESALKETPENTNLLFETACFMIQTGSIPQAINILDGLVKGNDKKVEYISKLGTANAIIGKRKEAIGLFKQALSLNSEFVAANANLALALAQEGEYQEALLFAKKGLELDPKNLPLYSTQALILKHMDCVDEAISSLRKAVELEANNVNALSNLAGLLIESGDKEGARNILEKVILFSPLSADAHRMLSTVTSYVDGHEHILQMERILEDKNLPPNIYMGIHYALGKAYESIKNFTKSFTHYKAANDQNRVLYQYDIKQDYRLFEKIKEVYTSEFIKSHQVDVGSFKPIFIVGMPRSGTSLIEQVLASHPNIYAAGELISIANLHVSDSNIDRSSLANLSKKYLDILEDRLGQRKVFTDKMPMNFRYLGFIKCLFPNAKIIHCQRGAMDTGLSIYKTKFVGYLPFAQNLREIGQYYNLYQDVMAYWHETMPEYIYDLSYEKLVHDFEGNIRALLEFCELDWAEDCLSFYENKRSVTTASTLQVREPVYQKSVNYWKNYESDLGELMVSLSSSRKGSRAAGEA